MGATNSTPVLELPQFVDGDKPSWRGDFNIAMDIIDEFFAAREPGKHVLTQEYYATSYGAVPDDDSAPVQAANTIALQAMMDDIAANGGGVGVLNGHFTISGTIVFRNDDVKLRGDGSDERQLVYTGNGVAIDFDSAAVRRRCGITDLRVYCVTAGATAIRLWNSYTGIFRNVRFIANQGTTSVAADFKGSRAVGFETSTYFNVFTNCEFSGSLASIRWGDDINRNLFLGGRVIGDGYGILANGMNYSSGTNMMQNLSFQTDAVNAGGKLLMIGATGGANVSYNTWSNCTFESFIAGRTLEFNATTATNNTIIGGSIAANCSVVGADYALNNNMVLYTSGNVTRHAFPKEVAAPSLRVAGGTASSEIQIQSSKIKANGTNALQALILASKGDTDVRINNTLGDGLRGVSVYTAQADGLAQVVRTVIGYGVDVLRGKNDAGFDTLRINQSGNMQWCDAATGTIDTTMNRIAADVLALGTNDSFRTGINTTANRPNAVTVGKGSQFYDSTLNKPIWSDGAVWRDAVGTAV